MGQFCLAGPRSKAPRAVPAYRAWPLPIEEALSIARDADASRATHANGVVYRDLKPANVRLGPEREVRVLDFGMPRR